jgi:hypothetical protein
MAGNTGDTGNTGAAASPVAALAARLVAAHPDHVPVIIDNECRGFALRNSKFLVTRDVRIAQFMCIVRKRLGPRPPGPAVALYMSSKGKIPTSSETIGTLYDRNRDPNTLLLHLALHSENTFGN